MIIGIGCDIVEHEEAQKLEWDSNPAVQNRIFSQKETEIYLLSNNIKFLCGRFAAKEAILKCLGTGMEDGIALTDIQILQSENGQPFIQLQGNSLIISEKLGINFWHISITHSRYFSIAYVIAECTDKMS